MFCRDNFHPQTMLLTLLTCSTSIFQIRLSLFALGLLLALSLVSQKDRLGYFSERSIAPA